jgi:hypothetical protein
VIFFLPRDIVVGEGFLWRSKIPRSYVRTSVRFETKLIKGGIVLRLSLVSKGNTMTKRCVWSWWLPYFVVIWIRNGYCA